MDTDLAEARRLRHLASEWRDYAEIGVPSARGDRIAWADHLERSAEEAERTERAKRGSTRY